MASSQLYAFKRHAFVPKNQEESDDEDFEAALDQDDELDETHRKGRGLPRVKKAKKTSATKLVSSSDDDRSEDDGSVEALAPVVSVPPTSFLEDDIIDVEEDEATTRRLNLIRAARSTSNKLAEADLNHQLDEAEEKEVVPVVDLGPTLTLALSCAGEEKVVMKIKSKDTFSCLFRSFAEDRGVPQSSCSFSFDGQKIRPNQTPNSLDMEDEDMIEVSAPPRTTALAAAEPFEQNEEQASVSKKKEKVSLLLLKAGSKSTRITLYDTDKFEKIFKHYAKTKNVKVRLALEDGTAILPWQTPLHHRMRGETKISVVS